MIALTSARAAVARAWSGLSMMRGTISAARMLIIVMTTSSSMSVKPWNRRFSQGGLRMTVSYEDCVAFIVLDSRSGGYLAFLVQRTIVFISKIGRRMATTMN